MTQYRILIAGQDKDENLALIHTIRSFGYELAGVAKTGEDAIQLAGEKHPHIILMDALLKGDVDGVSAAEKINARYIIPVIFMTTSSDIKTIRRASSTRLAGFLLKPYSEQDLKRSLEMGIFKHETEMMVSENRQWLETVLNSIGEGIIAINATGEIRLMNAAACEIIGISPHCEAQRLSDVLTLYRSSDDRAVTIPLHLKKRMNLSEIDYPLYMNHPTGNKIYIDGVISPLEEPEHGFSGIVLNIRDISESIVIKRVLHDAYKQIEQNLERFALLNDQIRNPLSVIVATLDIYESERLDDIMPYIKEIDTIIDQLDNGYITSSKIHGFLKRHHEID